MNREGQFKGSGHSRGDTIEQGAGTAGGMLVGGLIGGPPGILIGGAVGAGATTGHWLVKHRSTVIPAGTELTLELNASDDHELRPWQHQRSPLQRQVAAATDRNSELREEGTGRPLRPVLSFRLSLISGP